MEVTAPGLDDREPIQVMERDEHRAVPTRGQADDRARAAVAKSPEVPVHVGRHLARDRGLPAAPGAPVEVFRIGVVVSRALWCNDDRTAAALVERVPEEVDPAEGGRPGRQAVQEVHHRIPQVAGLVAGREVDRES